MSAEDLIARFKTNRGDFEVKLFHEEAPKTVSNFVELARAGKYDNVIFHRVIKDFMIQGGDPEGTGRGGPGYTFDDEPSALELSHDRPGLLSMANAGPNTNGSQFFVTVVNTEWLDGKHAIFGEVVKGYADVVEPMSLVETDPHSRPSEDIVMETIEILGDWFAPVEFR